MNKMMNKRTLKECILDRQNIYNAIYSMESYVFDKGLLDAESNVTLKGEDKDIIIPNDLVLFHLLHDKYNFELIERVIEACRCRLQNVLEKSDALFDVKVFFKLKKLEDDGALKFRPLHTARLIDLICMVSMLNLLMFEDDTRLWKRNLSDLSKLIPHNFFGNIPSTDPQHLFHKWQTKYKEYSDNVIEHCRQYQKNHKFQMEVSLDIKNFFPSISPKFLYSFIVDKLSATYRDPEDVNTLKSAVAKLLYFKLDKSNMEPWVKEYYGDEIVIEGDMYMNCGIPQGLPQSYFFGNICMLKVEKFLMDDDCFEGDAYFYVDDSVIYIQSKLEEEDFNRRIIGLNSKLEQWCKEIKEQEVDLNSILPSDFLHFQEKLDYTIRFHENGKSTCMHVDEIDTLTEMILDINRQTYDMSNLARNMDDLDDHVALGKLKALDKVISNEIDYLKKDENSTDKLKSNTAKSRLVLLRRFKKFFLYRLRRLKMKDDGGLKPEDVESFKERFYLQEVNPEKWFEQIDEDIFQTEYRLIIQNVSKITAEEFSNQIASWERKFLSVCQVEKEKLQSCFLFFSKDAKNAYLMKSLSYDSYASLVVWVKENYSGIRNSSSENQLTIFRNFLLKEDEREGWKSILNHGFQGKEYTRFVVNTCSEYQRHILNIYFSDIIGVQVSDALTFIKTYSRKSQYTELRILAYLRNRNFNCKQFIDFVENINSGDLSNAMGIDMELLEVLGLFIMRVRNPEWVDALICTHRLTKGLWYNGSKFLNSYTLHNEEHAVTLIHKSVELMNRIDFFTLKRVDYYILFLSCYLHDISMVIHPDMGLISANHPLNMSLISSLMVEMKKQADAFMLPNTADCKNARLKDAGQFLVDIFNKVYEFFEYRIRDNHAKDSAKFVLSKADGLLSFLQPTILSYVAKVSESHGYDVEDVYGLKSKAKEDTVSLKYMMILIRMADLLDVANDRVNYYLLRQNLKHLSSVSRFHWISHLVTDRVELKTDYKVNDGYFEAKKDKRMSAKELKSLRPVTETINVDLYLNFKQLTTNKNKMKCRFCMCEMKDDYMQIGIHSVQSHVWCSLGDCPVLCQWMMKKHEWLVHELIALNDYLFSVNDFLFKTKIYFNIHYKNEMRLDADMFDEVQKELANV